MVIYLGNGRTIESTGGKGVVMGTVDWARAKSFRRVPLPWRASENLLAFGAVRLHEWGMDPTRLRESFYAALRVVGGLLFSFHGMQKIFGLLTDKTMPEVFTQRWLGGMIELVTGVLIALGFLTRGAAFLASGTMAVAYIQFHWKFAFDGNFFPIMNKGELALLYCFLFLYFVAAGDGPFSIGSFLKRRASGRSAT